MNDLEHRLHAALRDAVDDPYVPGSLVAEAGRRAMRIRRRRVATRGAVGAAAVVATGAVVAQRGPAAPPTAVVPAASSSESAAVTAPAASTMTVSVARTPCRMDPPATAAACIRTQIDVTGAGDAKDFAVENGFAEAQSAEWKDPWKVVVRYADGTEETAPTRESGGSWAAEFAVRDTSEIVEVALLGADGEYIIRFATKTSPS